jgi:hypothetical protein
VQFERKHADGTLDGADLSWSSDRDGALGTGPAVQPADLTRGTHVMTVTTADGDGGTASRSITVHGVGKLPGGSVPAANSGPDQPVVEGDTVTLDGTDSTDAHGDALTYGWTQVAGPAVTLTGPASAPRFVAADDGTYIFGLTVTDGKPGSSSDEVTVTVDHAAPRLTIDSPTPDKLFKAGPVQLSASFTDAGAPDTHTSRVVWDNENGSPPAPGAVEQAGRNTGTCTAMRTLAAGVYTIRVTLTDDDGATAEGTVVVIVYNPKGGDIRTGGAVDTPAGSYPANAALKGRTTFAAVSAYQRLPPSRAGYRAHLPGRAPSLPVPSTNSGSPFRLQGAVPWQRQRRPGDRFRVTESIPCCRQQMPSSGRREEAVAFGRRRGVCARRSTTDAKGRRR